MPLMQDSYMDKFLVKNSALFFHILAKAAWAEPPKFWSDNWTWIWSVA